MGYGRLMTMTLTEAMPRSRFAERHTLDIDASPEQVWAALTELPWNQLRVTWPLMLIRGMGRPHWAGEQQVIRHGPVKLMRVDPPRYAVSASIGRPWKLRPTPGPEPADLEDIRDFDEPGWLKFGMDFTLQALPSGRTRIVTMTLCEPTDELARRRFRPYWVLIRPFSGLIRRDMLRAIAARAQQATGDNPAPGQRVLTGPAPRFGLPQYIHAEFTIPKEPVLTVTVQNDHAITLTRDDLDALPTTSKVSDLHCVMTWTEKGIRWTGWSFADLWTQVLAAHALPTTVELVFTGLDGAAASIPLVELLRDDVLVAHSRNGLPLARDHGAPYRLVVPQLYGYKHIKHLSGIDLVDHHLRSPHEPWIMHRIGRVENEQRHGLGMNRALRLTYSLVVRAALRSYGMRDPRFWELTSTTRTRSDPGTR